MQNNYYINYYQGESKKASLGPLMEQEDLIHKLEELKNENQLNTCFA